MDRVISLYLPLLDSPTSPPHPHKKAGLKLSRQCIWIRLDHSAVLCLSSVSLQCRWKLVCLGLFCCRLPIKIFFFFPPESWPWKTGRTALLCEKSFCRCNQRASHRRWNTVQVDFLHLFPNKHSFFDFFDHKRFSFTESRLQTHISFWQYFLQAAKFPLTDEVIITPDCNK